MATMTSYPHGVPNWIDLATPDPHASQAFHAEGAQIMLEPTPMPGAGTLVTIVDPQGAVFSITTPEAS